MKTKKFKKLSDILGVAPTKLKRLGVFNAFLEIDTPVYIDPRLLRESKHAEMQEADGRLEEYFVNVFRVMSKITQPQDIFYRKAWDLLTFPEMKDLSLGLSKGTNEGHGIGKGLARDILDNAIQILNAGIDDPAIFELVGVLNDHIGSDLVSDMTARITFPQLLKFSERVAERLGVARKSYKYKGATYLLPKNPITKKRLVLIPQDVLNDIPVARSWSDQDVVLAHNKQLRESLNEKIGHTWKTAVRDVKKERLREIMLNNPAALRDLLDYYHKKIPRSYDFDSDPEGYFAWEEIVEEISSRFAFKTKSFDPSNPKTLALFARELCLHFKKLVEKKGYSKALYKDGSYSIRRKEPFLQLLFHGIALTYCQPFNIKVSKEPNAGRGPVDFQLSVGSKAVQNIELKFSNHPNLYDGWVEQLEIYNEAEDATGSIYLVIQVTDKKPKQLTKIETAIAAPGSHKRPELVVIDGNVYPSASKKQ